MTLPVSPHPYRVGLHNGICCTAKEETFVMRLSSVLFVLALALMGGAAMAQEPGQAEPGHNLMVSDLDPEESHPLYRPSRALPIPVILDGVQFPAHYKLPDVALTFFVMKGGDASRVVYAFSSPAVAAEFQRRLREQSQAARAGDDSVTQAIAACTWTNDYSWFNKNVGCGGTSVLILTYPNQFTDLDFGGWNNTISCVKAACNGLFTVIYSCRNFQMFVSGACSDPDRWYISEGDIITDLNTVGMNNRTSSIRFE